MWQNFIIWFKNLIKPSSKKAQTDLEWTHQAEGVDNGEFFNSESKLTSKTYLVFYLVIGVIFLGLWFKLWSLQIAQGEYYSDLAQENRIRTKTEPASRGLIYDSNGEVLAQNQPGFSLMAYPADLPEDKKKRMQIYNKLKKLVSFDKKRWQKMEETQLYQLEPVILKENLTKEKALVLEEKMAEVKGIMVEDQIKRLYNSSAGLAHLIGYIGKVSQEEFESLEYDDLSMTDYLGKGGLEKSYNQYLKGTKGKKQVEVDSAGRVERVLAEKEPKVGNSLILSLDLDLQKKMSQSLEKVLKDNQLKKGVAIASDPKTGQILGMVSLPSYDNNIFSSPQVSEKYRQLTNNELRPLFDRVISGLYPTGSVIKPIVAAGGLEEEIVSADTWIDCKGEITVENRYNPDIVYRFTDWDTHGGVNITKAIAESCNVFFYHLGGGYGKISGLGYDKLTKYFKRFGLGKRTGIDLPLERNGLIPSPEWKRQVKDEVWYQGDTYHLSIGQGDLLATPLQVNNYLGAIANGGDLLKPRLVKKIVTGDDKLVKKFGPEYIKKKVVSKSSVQIVKQGMKQAVLSGTSEPLQDLPVSSGAKTGTAQTPQGEGEEHSWFTAFAPYENPEIAITVMVENGGEGYDSALPVAKETLNYYFSNK